MGAGIVVASALKEVVMYGGDDVRCDGVFGKNDETARGLEAGSAV